MTLEMGVLVRDALMSDREVRVFLTRDGDQDKASTARNYHSVALRMPDGRVWVTGSDKDSVPGLAARNLDIDIYQPWYHGNPHRPFVKAAPSLAYPKERCQIYFRGRDLTRRPAPLWFRKPTRSISVI